MSALDVMADRYTLERTPTVVETLDSTNSRDYTSTLKIGKGQLFTLYPPT
jgi:hypothetical protein